jgi:hypothetical protein
MAFIPATLQNNKTLEEVILVRAVIMRLRQGSRKLITALIFLPRQPVAGDLNRGHKLPNQRRRLASVLAHHATIFSRSCKNTVRYRVSRAGLGGFSAGVYSVSSIFIVDEMRSERLKIAGVRCERHFWTRIWRFVIQDADQQHRFGDLSKISHIGAETDQRGI